VIEAIVDTHEPPMPPATVAQAAKLAKALASGTPAGGKIARRIGVGMAREMI
jgi:pyruvate dehydrogenase (quinone)